MIVHIINRFSNLGITPSSMKDDFFEGLPMMAFLIFLMYVGKAKGHWVKWYISMYTSMCKSSAAFISLSWFVGYTVIQMHFLFFIAVHPTAIVLSRPVKSLLNPHCFLVTRITFSLGGGRGVSCSHNRDLESKGFTRSFRWFNR